MAGAICLVSGYQRSGKSLFVDLIALSYFNKKVPVYTNMETNDFIRIDKLTDLPLDKKPKVLLLDELHFYLNSRNFKSQADYIYFINTICKRNILLLGTCIHPDMIDKNMRMQINYLVLCKKDKKYLYYRIFDVQSQTVKNFQLMICDELFNLTNYDSDEIPRMFKFNIEEYIKLNEKYFS